jgi:23S rRNA (pseudouridine1915-N3)-methyltransferase
MSIRILCLGKTKHGFIQAGISEYLKRLGAFHSVKVEELPDVPLLKTANIEMVKSREAEIIRKALRPAEYLIVLDEHGKEFSSVEFSGFLEKQLANSDLCFVIGGVYGLDESIRAEAKLMLSFSRMTFTHQMIRMLLTEQLYRAFTIQKNKPYHY